MKKSGLVVKSYMLYDQNKNILLYHSYKFNEQQNKAINKQIMINYYIYIYKHKVKRDCDWKSWAKALVAFLSIVFCLT